MEQQLSTRIDQALLRARRLLTAWGAVEGAALWFLLAAGVFWLLFACDYFFEPPVVLRIILTLIALTALSVGVVHWLVRRWKAQPTNLALALMLERKFPILGDGLSTAVDLSTRRHGYSPALLRRTVEASSEAVDRLPLKELIASRLIFKRWLSAAAAAVTVLVLMLAAPSVAWSWFERVVLLSNNRYPRATRLQMMGFYDGARKVARGRDALIVVEADPAGVVPSKVQLSYRFEPSGLSSRVFATKVGGQRFQYTFSNLLESVNFSIRGGDDQVGPCRLIVVEPPRVDSVELQISYPAYTGLTTTRRAYSGGPLELVTGSRIRVEILINKPAEWLRCRVLRDNSATDLAVEKLDDRRFAWSMEVAGRTPIETTLRDADGVELAEPFLFDLAGQPDSAPRVEAALSGVSNAVTAAARIPIRMRVVDDFGVAELAFEHTAGKSPPKRAAVDGFQKGQSTFESIVPFEAPPLNLQPGATLDLTVCARDGNAGAEAHEGRSDPFRFEIVTPEELLARLAMRELNLRQRFEQTVRELQTAKKSLDELNAPPRNTDRLAVESLVIQLRKSGNETGGIALEFRAVWEEMINNRVTTSRLMERIEQGVVLPLDQVVAVEFPDAERKLEVLRDRVADAERPAILRESAESVDRLLAKCDEILKGMLKLESFNEVVSMLRSILTEQEKLNGQTREQRRKQVLDLLK